MTGASKVSYDERVLPADEAGAQRTVRAYREVAFHKTHDGHAQEAGIRPSVRRLVVLKAGAKKAPFSPDGPLLWDEIDVVRTDLFLPDVVPGLLPPAPVSPGRKWRASPAAVAELTDMEQVEEGELTVAFVAVTSVNGRRAARLELSGTVRGVNEDGPNRQALTGTLFYDLEGGYLGYLSIKGNKELLDGRGQVVGRIEGRFAMTRTPAALPADLADASLRGADLKPSPENSLLLYDNPDLGVRFLYPRGWRVGAVQGNQLTVDEPRRGGGILITLEAADRVPAPEGYLKEIGEFLKSEKAKDVRLAEPVSRVRDSPSLDRFSRGGGAGRGAGRGWSTRCSSSRSAGRRSPPACRRPRRRRCGPRSSASSAAWRSRSPSRRGRGKGERTIRAATVRERADARRTRSLTVAARQQGRLCPIVPSD